MDGLAIGAGIAQGLEKATGNFFNAMQAAKALKTKEEMDAITMKQHKLEIDKLEKDIGNIDPDQVAQRRRQISLQEKAMKVNFALAHENLQMIRQKRKKDVESLLQKQNFFSSIMRDPELSDRIGYGPSGLTLSPKKPDMMAGFSGFLGGDVAGSETKAPTKSLASVLGSDDNKRQKAIKFLTDAGEDTAEENIQYIMGQM